MAAVKPVPNPAAPLAPYLSIQGAAEALDFYRRAFGATERFRIDAPGGKIGHAEIEIAGALLMLADEFPEIGFRSPKALGGSPVMLHLYVPDVDAFVARAVGAGATLTRPVQDQFYGDRSGQLADPYGHSWTVATHKEDLSVETLRARAAEIHGGGAS